MRFSQSKITDASVIKSRGGGGVHDLQMNGGVLPGFQKATLFHLATVAVTHFNDEFWRTFMMKLPIVNNFLPIS